MSLITLPELLVSLTLQCTAVLLVTQLLATRACTSTEADRIWAHGHLLILISCLAGGTLPHVRILQHDLSLLFLNSVAQSWLFQIFFLAFFAVWLGGIALLSTRTLLSLLQTSAMVRRARSFSAATMTARDSVDCGSRETRQILAELQISLLFSNETVTPFCWQLHAPVIVLPESLLSFPAEELDAIVRHEVAHLRASHPLKLFRQTLVEILFWFHPLVWRSSREASLQRELASDLAANESASQAKVLLKGMVRLAEGCTLRGTSRLIAGLGFAGSGRSMIQARVDQLLSIDWSGRMTSGYSGQPIPLLWVAALAASFLWMPVNARVTDRTLLSPWPTISAAFLHECGIMARDYEQDSHRLSGHHNSETPY